MPASTRPNSVLRRSWLLLALALVVLAHVLLVGLMWRAGPSGALTPTSDIRPLQVALLQEMRPVAVPPPAVRQAPAAAPPRVQPVPIPSIAATEPADAPAMSASQPLLPEVEARESEREQGASASTGSTRSASGSGSHDTGAPDGSTPASTASAPQAGASDPATPPVDWPLSTRLSYSLTGTYRGEPVQGQARVEWLRRDARYQVHLAVEIGPSIAPLMERHLLSDGDITPAGLAPRLYTEDTRILWQPMRRQQVPMGADSVNLPGGRSVARPTDLQDSASQFVQFAWLFTTQPERARVGEIVRFPLMVSGAVRDWAYEVREQQWLATPVGTIPAWHLVPRAPSAPGVLAAEAWFAPQLQNLPVRIRLLQAGGDAIVLDLSGPPQQERAARPPG